VLFSVKNEIPAQLRNEQFLPIAIYIVDLNFELLEENNELCEAMVFIGVWCA
jgi:hypothetical protein